MSAPLIRWVWALLTRGVVCKSKGCCKDGYGFFGCEKWIEYMIQALKTEASSLDALHIFYLEGRQLGLF